MDVLIRGHVLCRSTPSFSASGAHWIRLSLTPLQTDEPRLRPPHIAHPPYRALLEEGPRVDAVGVWCPRFPEAVELCPCHVFLPAVL